MQIIDGHTGAPHWTSQQTADFYSATIALGNCVLAEGNRFAYEIVNNNAIKINDGMLLLQGRRGDIAFGSVDTCAIENGSQGAQRNDLIVCRYQKDAVTYQESMTLAVVRGADGQGDPGINAGTNIREGALIHDMPLYRVRLDGINIVGVDTLFEIWSNLEIEYIAKVANQEKLSIQLSRRLFGAESIDVSLFEGGIAVAGLVSGSNPYVWEPVSGSLPIDTYVVRVK